MIELVITCDRCGKTGGDGSAVQMGLSITNPARLHICSECTSAFQAWCAAFKPARKEKAA